MHVTLASYGAVSQASDAQETPWTDELCVLPSLGASAVGRLPCLILMSLQSTFVILKICNIGRPLLLILYLQTGRRHEQGACIKAKPTWVCLAWMGLDKCVQACKNSSDNLQMLDLAMIV